MERAQKVNLADGGGCTLRSVEWEGFVATVKKSDIYRLRKERERERERERGGRKGERADLSTSKARNFFFNFVISLVRVVGYTPGLLNCA